METSESIVFVYGSLKKGSYNHRVIAEAEFFGEASVTGFDMFSQGYYPAVVPGDGTIKVEMYKVDQDILRDLDILEGHPGLYCRHQVKSLDGVEGFLYVYQHAVSERYRIDSGEWTQQEWNPCRKDRGHVLKSLYF